MPFDDAGLAPIGYLQKIDKTIDLIGTPDKWGKGSLRTRDGRYCLRGAIREVDRAESLWPVILVAINEVTGRRYRRVESFNDHQQTDHEQIVAVLMRARENIVAGRIPPYASTRSSKASDGFRLLSWWNGARSWLC